MHVRKKEHENRLQLQGALQAVEYQLLNAEDKWPPMDQTATKEHLPEGECPDSVLDDGGSTLSTRFNMNHNIVNWMREQYCYHQSSQVSCITMPPGSDTSCVAKLNVDEPFPESQKSDLEREQ